jgi:chorismate synthase
MPIWRRALKYGFNDVRNVLERASARETAARVAAGAVARAFLRKLGIEVWSFTAEVGGVAVDPANCTRSREEADASPLRCPDPDAEERMIARIDAGPLQRRHGGWRIRGGRPRAADRARVIRPLGPPLGRCPRGRRHEHQHREGRRVRARIRANAALRVGGARRDRRPRRRGTLGPSSNNAGGLTGGVTNGEPLVVRGAVKPISTLARPLPSADLITGEAVEKAHYERSDISVVPAAGIVAEAMVMLTLAASSSRRSAGTPWPTLPPTSPRTGQGSRSRSTHRKPARSPW